MRVCLFSLTSEGKRAGVNSHVSVRRRDARLEAHPVADGAAAIKANNGLMSRWQAPAAPLASPFPLSPVRHTLHFFHICQRRLLRQCLPCPVWAPFFTGGAAIGRGRGGRGNGRNLVRLRPIGAAPRCILWRLVLITVPVVRPRPNCLWIPELGCPASFMATRGYLTSGHAAPATLDWLAPAPRAARTGDLILEAGNKRLRLPGPCAGRREDRQTGRPGE